MTKTYDPKKVSVVIGGHIVSGYADGTYINIDRNNQTWSRTGGADGEQARAKSNDKSGTITITLMQTSVTNAVLAAFATADELSNNAAFVFAMYDENGSEVATAAIAWVQKPAARGFGKEIENREWVIETGELVLLGGGTFVDTTTSVVST